MARLRWLVWFVAGTVLLLAGCKTHVIVAREMRPNPFGRASPFYVARPSFEGLRIGSQTREAYIAAKAKMNDSKPSLLGDQTAIVRAFADGFDDAKAGLVVSYDIENAYVVQTNVFFIEPGPSGPPSNLLDVPPETALEAEMKILDAEGTLMDRVLLHAGHTPVWAPNGIYPPRRERMRACAEKLGAMTAARLKQRAEEPGP